MKPRYTLFLLVLVYTFNFLDRQLLVILQESIKADLGLADWQLGVLSGIAFAALYTIMGVPIARVADRGNRRNIIAMALAAWSVMTALCGLVQSFWHLLVARIGVGIGEAGCSPPAHSMLSDLFPKERRATVLSIYNIGISLGILLGLVAGGWLNDIVGWRRAFFLLAAPGVLLALWFRFTVPEAPRPAAPSGSDVEQPSLKDVISLLWSRPSFRHLAAGVALHAFVAFGAGNWAPSFFIRVHGLSAGVVGSWLGPIVAVAGILGNLSGGWLADRFGARDPRWMLWVPGIAILLSVPLQIPVYLVANAQAAMLLLFLPRILGGTFLGPSIAATHGLVNSRMRAVASSLLFLIMNLIGMGLGPWFTGLLSDLLGPRMGVDSLRWALVVVVLFNVWSAIHFLLAGLHLQRDMEAAPSLGAVGAEEAAG